MTKLELNLLSESLDNPKVTKKYLEQVIRDLHNKISAIDEEINYIIALEMVRVITKALALKNIAKDLPAYITNMYIYKELPSYSFRTNNKVENLFDTALKKEISAKDLNYYFEYVNTIYVNFEYTYTSKLNVTELFKLVKTFLDTPTHLKFEIKSPAISFYTNIPLHKDTSIIYITIHSILYQLNRKKSIITDQLFKELPIEATETLQEEIQNYKLQLASMNYAVTQFEKELNELPIN